MHYVAKGVNLPFGKNIQMVMIGLFNIFGITIYSSKIEILIFCPYCVAVRTSELSRVIKLN